MGKLNIVCKHIRNGVLFMPMISYYELMTTTGFCYDNAERSQGSNVEIDIRGGGYARLYLYRL